MKAIYLTRTFHPVTVSTHKPGEIYQHPALGECRRVTAQRLCLAANRLGRTSESILGLLRAIGGAAVNGCYDGRTVESWYGLVGLLPPAEEPDRMVTVQCPTCGITHWALEEKGQVFEGGVCTDCWSRHYIAV
jgi:hypothetical protein